MYEVGATSSDLSKTNRFFYVHFWLCSLLAIPVVKFTVSVAYR